MEVAVDSSGEETEEALLETESSEGEGMSAATLCGIDAFAESEGIEEELSVVGVGMSPLDCFSSR